MKNNENKKSTQSIAKVNLANITCMNGSRYCSNCDYFDPSYKGGYCDKKKVKVSSSDSCDLWK